MFFVSLSGLFHGKASFYRKTLYPFFFKVAPTTETMIAYYAPDRALQNDTKMVWKNLDVTEPR